MPVLKMSDCLFEIDRKLYFDNGNIVIEIPHNLRDLSEEIEKLRRELKASRKVVEAARHIHWQGTRQRMENLHMALKEMDGEVSSED